jgi:long-chain acyl-CoA synthetase
MSETIEPERAQLAVTYHPQIRTLGDAPRLHGRTRGGSPAFHFEGETVTYAEFDRRTAQVANGLLAEGVGHGARIAYLGKNSTAYFELLFGAARIGAVLAPVNWRLAEPEVVYITADAEAQMLFVDSYCAALAERAVGQIPSVRKVIAMDGPERGWEGYAAWRDRQSDADQTVEVAPTDVAIQLYTSGTTGRPKGVQLSHQAFYAFAAYAGRNPEAYPQDMAWNLWSPHDVSLVAMPVFHISGSGWGVVGVYAGAFTVVLREFENAAVIGAIREFKISKTVLVPTTIQMMLEYPGVSREDFASMTDFLYGAAPIPLDLLQRAVDAFGCGFIQLYGMTETCGAVTYLPADDHWPGNPRMRSAGKPIPGAEIRILDPDSDVERPTGEVGEICIRAPTTMNGYWKQDDETLRVIRENGWVRSGDAGYLDEDGYLFIRDRVKDMIVSGGENVYPAEVENAIYGHPAVAEVAVIGVPDDKWGEAVKAVVALKPDQPADPESIIVWARQRIAGYKVPKSVDFVEALPRNASGKVLKRDLRAPYWSGRERQVN